MEIVTSSGLKSSDGVICAVPCKLHAITLIQASAACSVLMYDNASAASGLLVEQLNNTVNSSTTTTKFNSPVTCNNGLYADVSGSGAGYIVHYSIA